MPGSTRLAPPAEFPAGWARWAALAVFALFVAVALGLGQLNLNGAAAPNAVAAGAAAVVAVGADTVELAVDSAGEPGTGTGLGVLSMRERAESLGGSCRAGPGGRGWLVRATLPLGVSWQRADAT
jgi:hypothetical protein